MSRLLAVFLRERVHSAGILPKCQHNDDEDNDDEETGYMAAGGERDKTSRILCT